MTNFFRKVFRFIFLLLVVLSFAIFLQNDMVLELKLLFWKKEFSLYFLTGTLFLSGFLVGIISYFLMFSGGGNKNEKMSPSEEKSAADGGRIIMPPEDS